MLFFSFILKGNLLIEDEFVGIGGLHLVGNPLPLMLQVYPAWEFNFEG